MCKFYFRRIGEYKAAFNTAITSWATKELGIAAWIYFITIWKFIKERMLTMEWLER